MRVLIVKLSAMGDILHALSVLPYLHAAEPGIEVDWVVEEVFAELLYDSPFISQVHVVALKKWKKQLLTLNTLKAVLAAQARLKSRKYDAVFDIQGNIKSGLVTWLTKCKKRVGFDSRLAQERLNSFFINYPVSAVAGEQHVTDQYLQIIGSQFALDFHQLSLPTAIRSKDKDALWAEELVNCSFPRTAFVFHTGTTWQTKFWYKEGWIALAQRILKQYKDAVIYFSWGNKVEQELASEIITVLGSRTVLLEKVPLGRLAALIKVVDLVIGGDTGVVHMAAAVGTPTVSYYRSSDGLRSGPRGPRDYVIQAPMPCAKCFKTKCNKDSECRQSITPDAVFTAVQRALGE